MNDPFTTANAALFAAAGNVDATVRQGASSWSRRVLLSLDVESVDMTSGATARINTAQFPRIGGLRPKVATLQIGASTYVCEARISDDGYAETWRVSG